MTSYIRACKNSINYVLQKFVHAYTVRMYDNIHVSFIVVTMNSKDRYEIIGLCKISHSIKQPCGSICLKKRYQCIKVAETMYVVSWLSKAEN